MNLWKGGLLCSKLVCWGPIWASLMSTALKPEELVILWAALSLSDEACKLESLRTYIVFLGPPGCCSEMQVLLADIMGQQVNCQTL